MIEYAPYVLGGIAIGTVAGVLPGVGITIFLVLLFPFLLNADPIGVVLLYVSMVSITQFTGSVTGIVFGVPGEVSSLPAVKEGHRLFLQGKGTLALAQTAIGSVVGSLLCVGFVFLIAGELDKYAFFYSTYFQSVILVCVLAVIAFQATNHPVINCALMAIGYGLAMLGVNSLNSVDTITFGITDLLLGIPLFPVIVWLYVFPQILRNWSTHDVKSTNVSSYRFGVWDNARTYIENLGSSLRGTVIGFFFGFVPYLTTIISANLSYSIEVRLQKWRGRYSEQGDLPSLVSSETANNAAALSSLLPLLLIGIPITTSEALLLEIVTAAGHIFYVEDFENLFYTVAVCLVFTNFIGLVLCWPLAHIITFWHRFPLSWIYSAIIAICAGLTVYMGFVYNAVELYVYSSILFAGLGYALRKTDTIPLIFAFIMQDSLENNLTRLIFYML